jgi:hypothetical protein
MTNLCLQKMRQQLFRIYNLIVLIYHVAEASRFLTPALVKLFSESAHRTSTCGTEVSRLSLNNNFTSK